MKELHIEDKWYISSNPNKKIFGKLEFQPFVGTKLRLYGSFPFGENSKDEIIHGITSEGEM